MIRGIRWKCKACGSDFSEPQGFYPGSRFFHSPYAIGCPNCKSEDIAYASECDACERFEFDDKLKYGICEDCLEKFLDMYSYDYAKENFDSFAFFMHKRLLAKRVNENE